MIDPKPYIGEPAHDRCSTCGTALMGLLLTSPGPFGRGGFLDLDPNGFSDGYSPRCVQDSINWPDLRRAAIQLAL